MTDSNNDIPKQMHLFENVNTTEDALKAIEKDHGIALNYEDHGHYGALYEFHKKLVEKFTEAGHEVAVRHQKLGQNYIPGSPSAALRAELIKEEANELIEALAMKPAHECLKEICDLIYVTVGTAVVYGWPLEIAFERVHMNNMAKIEKGTPSITGKLVKPVGWVQPNIKELL